MSFHLKSAEFPIQQIKGIMKKLMTYKQNMGKNKHTVFSSGGKFQMQTKVENTKNYFEKRSHRLSQFLDFISIDEIVYIN